MMDRNFLISGTAINLSAQTILTLPARKFYNPAYFNDNQYHHEIANHFRDFQLRRRIKQRKAKVNLKYCKAAKELPHEYQPALPIAVHMFPSFEKVYTPRGRQTLCEQRRPDLTYNDNIKRIQSVTQNIEILKKQVERLKRQNQGKQLPNGIKTKDSQTTANESNINKNFKANRQQLRRRSLGKLESFDYSRRRQQPEFPSKCDCGAIRAFSTKLKDLASTSSGGDSGVGYIGAETLEYYLKLATDYYQQGFLQNIKYLKSLEVRNQLRRKRQSQKLQQKQEQQQRQQKVYTFDDLSERITNILTTTSNSVRTESITDATLNSCAIKYEQNHQNNPIERRKRQQIDKLTANKIYPNNNSHSKYENCAIRVNIKPQTANTNYQENFFGLKNDAYGKKKIISKTKDFNSMNHYLNGNLQYTQLQQQQQEHHHHLQQQQQQQTLCQNSSVNNQNHSAKVLLIDTLIDNLRELDIQENRTNLPRIILTDYTHRYPTEINSDQQIQTTSALNSPDEHKRHPNSYLLKQSSLDCSGLDIPLKTPHYHSEARPPPSNNFSFFTMVAIEHRSTSANTSTSILSPTSNTSVTSASTSAASTSMSTLSTATANTNKKMSSTSETLATAKSAVSQRDVEVTVSKQKATATHKDSTALELSKKVLKLDLTAKEVEEYSLKSPKSPVVGRLPHQTSLTSSVDVEDRKTLREALYQGIFHRHRRTIFAVGSFLRMLRSRNSQYNTIRSTSEGEDIDEVR